MAQNLQRGSDDYYRQPCFDPSVLTAEACKFLVGPRRKEYVVHHSALANLPPILDVMESYVTPTGSLLLGDVEEDVFTSLCEFVYTGDYFIPRCQEDTSPYAEHYPDSARHGPRAVEILGEASKNTCFAEEQMDSHRYCNMRGPTKYCSFCDRTNCECGPCHMYMGFKHVFCKWFEETRDHMKESEYAAFCFYRHTIKSSEDSTQVLLHHAKLYMLGDRFKLDALKAIAANRMFWALKEFPIVWRRIPDLVPMFRYIYCNTTKDDVLRLMVSRLAAVFAEKLMLHAQFKALLQEQFEFCYDVLQTTSESTRAMRECIQQRRRIE